MGCGCKKENKKNKLLRINNRIKMAKTKYKIKDGVSPDTMLVMRNYKIKVSDLNQTSMKVFFDAGNPNIVKDESDAKKKTK